MAELHDQLEPLIKKSDTAFREQLKGMLHVDPSALHMVVLKLLVTKPGAAAQEVHLDEVKDANKSWGVLLHCSNSDKSTLVPKDEEHLELLRKLTQMNAQLNFEELKMALALKKDKSDGFSSEGVQVGDALFFRTDVAHYGPVVGATDQERVILYALFSIEPREDGKDHKDEVQLHPLADLKSHCDKFRAEMKQKQQEHLAKGHRLTAQAKHEFTQAQTYATQIKEINNLVTGLHPSA